MTESGASRPQESVWDYPRPPRLEHVTRSFQVKLDGVPLVQAPEAWRILETSHPPTFYFAPRCCVLDSLKPAPGRSLCEWKGQAHYYDVVLGERLLSRAAWSYAQPWPGFEPIRDAISFYPSRFECFVDGERVRAQKGDFYGGWITREIVGPFKGEPGTEGW